MDRIDMSKSCGLKYMENWIKTHLNETMSQNEWSKWYDENCGKCEYMCEVCMYGEK